MNAAEAKDAAKMARELMPMSNDAQQALLEKSISRFTLSDALIAIGDHAEESEFISVPEIIRRLNTKPDTRTPSKRLEDERAAFQIRQAQAEAEHREATRRVELTQKAFAEMPDDELEAMKQRAIASLKPESRDFMQKHNARTNLVLQAVIKRVCA